MPRVLRALVVFISILSVHGFLRTFRSLTMSSKGFDLKAALAAADAPKITDFDRKVYEACSRVPKGNTFSSILSKHT
jgi:hypothetical protein